MMDERLLFRESEQVHYNMNPIKINPLDDDVPIHLSKNYAKLEYYEKSIKLIYDPIIKPSVSFKFIDHTKEDQFLIFNEKLEKHLQKTVNDLDTSKNRWEINFFNRSLREFINSNPMYDIFIVFLNEIEDKKYLKLDKNHVQIKSYDWEYFSEKWFNRRDHFENTNTNNVNEFFKAARNCFIVELKILSDNKERRGSNSYVLRKGMGGKQVFFFLFDDTEELQKFLKFLKYSVFFSKPALGNYFYSYVIDLIFNFVMPSNDLISFYKNIGIILKDDPLINSNLENNNISSIIFPFQNICNILEKKTNEKMITNFLNKQINFQTFIENFNKYEESYYSSDKFHISSQNLYIPLFSHCNKIKIDLDENLGVSKNYEKFFFHEIKKLIEKYISFKGCFNIDIILSNDNKLVKNKIWEKFCKILCFVPKCIFVDFFNKIFKCNEGFFHKHIQMFDLSYSFNQRNIIHNFHYHKDASQKNKIRLFDILFREEWISKIASIITFILHFKSDYYNQEKNFENIREYYFVYATNIIKNTRTTIFEIFNKIENEVFEDFPSFDLFCEGLYKFPIKKYNYIDNVCHHFANYSVNTLLKNNYSKFSFIVLDMMRTIKLESKLSNNCPVKNYFPQLDSLYEESFILYDKELNNYLMQYFSLDKYLNKFLNCKDFINKLKQIDCEMNSVSLFEMGTDEISDILRKEKPNNISFYKTGNNEDVETFPFAMFFNLFHFHKFEKMKEIFKFISEYNQRDEDQKGFIFDDISCKIQQIKELSILVKNMTYKFYHYANYIRSRLDKKKLQYPTSIGQYLTLINSDNVLENNDFYKDNYIALKNKIMLI